MYEDVLEKFEDLLLKKEVMGISDTEDHEVNREINDCLKYLDRHL